MTSNVENHKRFSTLLELLIEGTASPEQISELIDFAKQDRELKYILRTQLETDNMLLQALSPKENTSQFIEQIVTQSKDIQAHKDFEQKVLGALPKASSVSESNGSDKYAWIISGLSIAFCIIVSVLALNQIWIFANKPNNQTLVSTEIQDQGVAIVVNAVGLDNSDLFVIGKSVPPGKIEIKSGFLELEFYHGAQLKIAGPAEVDLVSAKQISLLQGKVMTQVPTVAKGFITKIPNHEVKDFGRSIGIQVDTQGNSQVHVFDGSIEVISENGDRQRFATGDAVNFSAKNKDDWKANLTASNQFDEFSGIDDLTHIAISEKYQQWLDMKQHMLLDKHLIAYYDFEPIKGRPRLLKNLKEPKNQSHGAIVGAKWSKGPWLGKSALEFKRAADRVRIEIDEKLNNFTLAAWVKIDSLDRTFNSLLLTDGFKPGDLHWQIGNFNPVKKFGTIVLGLSTTYSKNRNYQAAPFFTPAESGTWYHLAVTVDQENVNTYVNGKLFRSNLLTEKSDYWKIGKASIANWDSMNLGSPLRNLNGSMAELIILSRALKESEINALALNEKI
ncbi:LamG domain-containing protein [Paraglaciecola aquimarina]|uniref:LamG domain-containing protein n=1 Tax=Paraglaciecola algarum TaxID=3050085 RepID=A0ABS9D334_9ALTE|nr:LamG domain-containing protein [Paraglaciecola sp. G1-23]MCF2947337.1 LamG domain-containing protein [Paraglaciecola sp. G1-23]